MLNPINLRTVSLKKTNVTLLSGTMDLTMQCILKVKNVQGRNSRPE